MDTCKQTGERWVTGRQAVAPHTCVLQVEAGRGNTDVRLEGQEEIVGRAVQQLGNRGACNWQREGQRTLWRCWFFLLWFLLPSIFICASDLYCRIDVKKFFFSIKRCTIDCLYSYLGQTEEIATQKHTFFHKLMTSEECWTVKHFVAQRCFSDTRSFQLTLVILHAGQNSCIIFVSTNLRRDSDMNS